MNRREIIFSLLNGPERDKGYVPAAFFLHFNDSSKLGADAIERHKQFFHATGMDFVKIQYERNFPHQPIRHYEDWQRFRPLSIEFYEPQLAVVRGLVEALKAEAPVIVTLYSPFMCLGDAGTKSLLVQHLRESPDALTSAFEAATESLLQFVLECIRIGVDGFYHSTQGGESRRFPTPETFEQYIKPWDLVLMREIERRCSFNILHICDYHKSECGGYDDLTPFLNYPGSLVNCSTEIGGKSVPPQEISKLFGRPFIGGLDRNGVLSTGTPDQVRAEAKHVLASAPDRFILGADCTVPANTPWENLKAAVDTAHGVCDG